MTSITRVYLIVVDSKTFVRDLVPEGESKLFFSLRFLTKTYLIEFTLGVSASPNQSTISLFKLDRIFPFRQIYNVGIFSTKYGSISNSLNHVIMYTGVISKCREISIWICIDIEGFPNDDHNPILTDEWVSLIKWSSCAKLAFFLGEYVSNQVVSA